MNRTIFFNFLTIAGLMALFIAALSYLPDETRAAASKRPPSATAKLCGNRVVRDQQKTAEFVRLQAEGCDDVRFVHVGGGWWLAFGTRILTAEVQK